MAGVHGIMCLQLILVRLGCCSEVALQRSVTLRSLVTRHTPTSHAPQTRASVKGFEAGCDEEEGPSVQTPHPPYPNSC